MAQEKQFLLRLGIESFLRLVKEGGVTSKHLLHNKVHICVGRSMCGG